MRFKRVAALLLVGIMTLSMVGCGKSTDESSTTSAGSGTEEAETETDTATGEKEKIVIWTLAEDLKTFAEHYIELNENVEIETVIIAPADYSTKLTAALRGKSEEPDIIVGEPQMLPEFFEAGFFEDLSQAPYNAEDYKDLLVDYVFEAGRSEDGAVRALSYQVTPVGIYYRRDIAKTVWGNDDPAFVSEKFSSFETIVETATEMDEAGYKIFADTGNLRWFTNGGGAWVQDGKLVLSDEKRAYMDSAVQLYTQKLTAFAPEWSAAWYASMSGEIPTNAEWATEEELSASTEAKTQVFAYALPSWGALIVRDNAGDNAGSFGVASGPCAGFGGGTFVGINTYSDNKDAAWDFVKFVTLDEETSKWWTEKAAGDVVSMKSVLDSVIDVENETYGNQKTYAYFLEEANKIDYSLITKYDDAIGAAWGTAIESVQKGLMSEEDAISEFYNSVRSIYPELEITE